MERQAGFDRQGSHVAGGEWTRLLAVGHLPIAAPCECVEDARDEGADVGGATAVDGTPDVERGLLVGEILPLDMRNPGHLGRKSMCLEGRGKGVVEEIDQTATTPPVPVERQVSSSGRLADVLSDVGDEVWIGLAKAVDRLFGIADPNARGRQGAT